MRRSDDQFSFKPNIGFIYRLIICFHYSDCEFTRVRTSVLNEGTSVQFGADIGGVPNPVEIDFGMEPWKVSISM